MRQMLIRQMLNLHRPNEFIHEMSLMESMKNLLIQNAYRRLLTCNGWDSVDNRE